MSEQNKGEKENFWFLKKLINNIFKEENKMSYSGSKSTDKLKIMADAAQEILSKNPEIAHRIKSVSIKWISLPNITVPDIQIEFYDTPKNGINLQK